MRKRIVGGLVAAWGGGIIVYGLVNRESGGGAYEVGQWVAIVLGACMLIGGLFYLITGGSNEGTPPNRRGPRRPGQGKR
jgi:hypothetical protein